MDVSSLYNIGYSYGMSGASTFLTVALILSLVIALGAVIFFLPAFNKGRFAPALNAVYEFFNFSKGWARALIKFAFIFLAVLLFLFGIYIMFTSSFVIGLIMWIMILVVRVGFEVVLAVMDIRDNTKQINAKMPGDAGAPQPDGQPEGFAGKMAARQAAKRENYAQYQMAHAEAAARAQSAPVSQGAEPAKPAAAFCGNCGAQLREGAVFCPSCGAKVNK